MRPAERLFDIMQLLRGTPRRLPAGVIAERLEVATRTIYRDGEGTESRRIVWPLAIAYFAGSTLIGAWCELRSDYRDFRTDRVQNVCVLDDSSPGNCAGLLSNLLALQEQYAAASLMHS